jgi:putative flippase GtrA
MPRLRQWLRHHAASAVAAVVDFGVMVACVEALRAGPVAATVAGAACGAVANFLLGRYWIYGRGEGDARPQFVRYGFVSATSLGLNAAGEHLFANVLGVQYVVARVITAVIVSNAWNYPMQRFFVFRARRASA